MFPSFNPGHVGIKVDLAAGLALAERHGFGGYDAQLAQLHEAVQRDGAAATRAAFIERGLRLGAWNLPFMPYRETDESFRDWLSRLPAMVASAQAVGALRAGMWILPGHDERPFDDNFAFHVERFTPVARLLADHGIRLGLEFVGPRTARRRFQHPFVHDLAGVRALGRAIGPNCGLLLDCWHWHCSGGTRDDLRALSRDELVHVHVNDAPPDHTLDDYVDNRRRLPGTTGVIDLDGFMAALAAARYDGPVTAEPFDAELSALPAEESAARTARTTRSAVARAG